MYDDEEKIIQEQENKGQQAGLSDVVQNISDIKKINDRIKEGKLKNATNNNTDIDVTPKKGPKVGGTAGKNAAGGAGKGAAAGAGTSGTAAGSAGAATGGAAAGGAATGGAAAGGAAAGGAAAGGAAAGGAAAGGAAAAGAAAGGAGAAAGGAALFATPVGWIIFGVVLALILSVIVTVPIGSAGVGMGAATGLDEDILVQDCEKHKNTDFYEECQEIKSYLNGTEELNGKVVSGLRSKELFNKMLQYCDKAQPFGKKLEKFLLQVLIDEEQIMDGCDLARIVEKYVSKKENDTKLELSRGLIIATLEQLYNSAITELDVSEKDSEENQIDKKIDSSSPNNILANIAASGLISPKEIKILVEYMVTTTEYTYYNWVEARDDRYNCKTIKDEDGNDIEKCKTKITYSCKKEQYHLDYADPEKYFMFLRYGGSYTNEIITSKVRWSYPVVTSEITDTRINDFYKGLLGDFVANLGLSFVPSGYLVIFAQDNMYLNNIYDPTMSYQELKSFNEAVSITSDECKIRGLATVPESTEDTIYKIDWVTVNDALNAYENVPITDLTGYVTELEDLTKPVKVPGIRSGCRLNHSLKNDTERCTINDEELSYQNGFIYKTFPNYANNTEEIDYKVISQNIEKMVKIIDQQEDYLNDIFGFGSGYGNSGYYPTDGCLKYDNYKIRLRTCSASSEEDKRENSKHFPGGASLINGNYVANETITMDEYMRGVTYAEAGELFYKDKIEALKFQIIAIKSYILSKNLKETNGEIIIDVGSACAQNYVNTEKIAARYMTVFEEAYNEVKNILFYNKSTNEIFRAEYRGYFTIDLVDYALEGYKYTDMLTLPKVLEFPEADYSNAIFGTCSATTAIGMDFIQNALQFVGWNNMRFINSEYKAICNFRSGSPWCARFVNLIKELTPQVAEKVGPVDGQAGVKNWMRHFATKPGLTFYSSQSYSSVGYYQSGLKYNYSMNSYRPKAGDLIFYSWSSNWNRNPLNSENQDHIAIIIDVYEKNGQTCLKTVEGNVGGHGDNNASSVKIWDCNYTTSSSKVVGYGAWE